MNYDLDVNPAYALWRSSTGSQKEQAYRAFLSKLQSFAMSVCWQKIPDHKSELAALANGIVWRAIQGIDKFKGKSRFSTWFYRIAVNECKRYLRDYKEQGVTALPKELPGPQQEADARLTVEAILKALHGEDRLLLELVAEGHTLESISRKMKIDYSTTRKRWSRLKEKIRDAWL